MRNPPLCHSERTRISYFTALPAATYAALRKESRMKSTETTVSDRKSGGAEGPAVRLDAKQRRLCFATARRVRCLGTNRLVKTASSLVGPLFDVKAHSRSLGSPRFPVRNRSFGGFHAALFTESRIRRRW